MTQPRNVFIGKVRWRYRWREIAKALKILWYAVLGYHQSIEWYEQDTDDLASLGEDDELAAYFEEFVILVNAGRRVLSVPEMEELMRQCGATTWYQAATPQAFDVEEALELSQDIAALCQGDLTGREL